MKKHTLLLIAFVSLQWIGSETAKAQTCGEFQLTEIRKKYQIGKFRELIQDASGCLNRGFSESKQNEEALALLAKTYIEINEFDTAAVHVDKLLLQNPNYEAASGDPGLFKKMIADSKLASIAQTVTSVSKKAENVKEAPASVLVITEKDIRERGYTDIEQIFSDLPGFDISRTYGITYSNLYQRGYRSDNTDRTLLLVDGIEDNDLWSGGIYLARQYPITNIKRIEVVYGPASTMYGANAFLGVINIVTKDAQSFSPNSSVSASAEIGYGSYNTQYADVNLMLRKNNVSLSFTARKFYSQEMDLSDYPEFNFSPDDYNNFDYATKLSTENNANIFARENGSHENFNELFAIETNSTGDTTAVRLTPSGEKFARNGDKAALTKELNGNPIEYSNLTDHLYLYGKLKVSDFTFGVHSWQSKNGTTNYYHDNRRAGPDNGAIWEPKQTFVYAKYDKELGDLSIQNVAQYKVSEVGDESNTVEVRNYSNGRLSATDLLKKTEPFWYNFYISTISKQFRNELKVNYSPNSKLNLVSGVEIRNSVLQGDYRISYDNTISAIESGTASADALPGGNNYHIFDIGAYLQGSYEILPILKLTLGGRYDYNRIRVTGGYGSQFSPRVALVATPNKFILKGIYAQAFQNASILKKFATTDTRAANPNLQPELATNIEFSVGYQFSKKIFADIVYYRATYDGVASIREGLSLEDGKTQQFQAVGELQVQGIQANVMGKWRNLNFFGNYTFTNPKNNLIMEGNKTGTFQRVGDISSHQFNLGVGATFWKHLHTFLKTNYVGERLVGSGTSVAGNPGLADSPGSFPATAILTGTLAYQEIIEGLNLQLIVNNILNTEYFDPGIRSANVSTYAYRIPQRRRNFILRLSYDF